MMRVIERANDSASSGRGRGRGNSNWKWKIKQCKVNHHHVYFYFYVCFARFQLEMSSFYSFPSLFWILSLSIHPHTRLTTLFILFHFFVRILLYVAHNLIHACSWQKYFTNVYSAIRTFTFVRIKIVMIWLFPVGFQSTRTFDTASHHFNQMEILLLLFNKNTFVQYLRASSHIHTLT